MKTKLLTLLVLLVAGGLAGCIGPGYDYGPYGPGYGYYPDGVPVYSYGYPYPGYGSALNFTYIHRGHDLRHHPTFHGHRDANFNRSMRGDLRFRQDLGRRDFRQSARERVPEFHQHRAPRQAWGGHSPEQRNFWGSRPANGRALRCSGSRC